VDPTYRTRIGLAYRSSVKYHIAGNVNFSTPSAPNLPSTLAPYYAVAAGLVAQDPRVQNGGISADVKLPDFANLSFFHTMLNDKWDFMADVQWTNWSTIQDLTFVRTTGAVLASTPYHWKDAWRVSGGVNYRYTDQWVFRGGLAWDQSPVPDQYRSPRLPDEDRIWLTGGVQYKWTPTLKFDLGAAYVFIKDPSIAQISTSPAVVAQYGYLSGNYSNHTLIVSGQATWNF
jgi:long-chain fatty acid transport protein